MEINLNPGLEISSPLISKLVPRMVDDALKLTIDAKYYKNKEENPSKYHVDGYDDMENMWEKFNVIWMDEKIIIYFFLFIYDY